MPIDLKNKVALITGGSAGLGAEIATQLASEGTNVAINYAHSKKRAEELAINLAKKYNIKAITIQGDLFKPEVIPILIKDTIEQLGGLDIVISNAGWTKFVPFADLDSADDELWEKTFQINVKAHFYLFRAAKPYFEQNKDGGTFIASASLAGRAASGSSLPYSVSKAALIHLIKGLAKTNGPKVRAHAVCPGLLLTEWGSRFSEEQVEGFRKRSPISEIPDVEETAFQYIVLCKSRTSTGSIVGVDGGASLL